MRRSINPQIADYVADNELICFGLSEHEFEEKNAHTMWTDKATTDLNVVSF